MSDTLIICLTVVSCLLILLAAIKLWVDYNNPYAEEIINERQEEIYSIANPNQLMIIYTIRREYKNGQVTIYNRVIEH